MKKRIATAIFLTMLLTLAGGCTDSKDTATSSSTLQTEQQQKLQLRHLQKQQKQSNHKRKLLHLNQSH